MFSQSLPVQFPPQNESERAELLAWIRGVSLVYGPWKTFKRLFKDVEAAYSSGQPETAIFAAILARIEDASFVHEPATKNQVPPIVRGKFSAIQVVNSLLYAVEGGEDLVVYDLKAPLEPSELFRYSPPTSAPSYNTRLRIEGERLVQVSSNQLRAFDLRNPREPRLILESNVLGSQNVDILNHHVVVADYQNLRILNWPASNSAALTEAGRVATSHPYNLAVKPGLVALSHWDLQQRKYAMSFFDVTNPHAPEQVSRISDQNPGDWKFLNDVLARLSGEELVFTDFSNPKNPRQISKIRVSGARNFHIAGDKVYVACFKWQQQNGNYGYERKLRIIDISQLHSPRLAGEFEAQLGQMASYGDLLYYVENGIKILDVTDASRVQPVGQRPTNATFAYLKRRSRRFLRILAEADSTAFVALADAFLSEAGHDRDELDLKANWTSAELVFGSGPRWKQKSHGRGDYVKDTTSLVIKSREERAPQAWDEHLDVVRAVWSHPHLPWQTQEMALKILQSHGEVLSSSPAQLSRFLWSNSPSLLKYAARQGRAHLNELENRAYAPLIWLGNTRQRTDVLSFIETRPELKSETGTHLATLLGLNATGGLGRRSRDIALLIAARFDLSDSQFSAEGAIPAISLLLASAEAPLRTLGLNFCRRLSAGSALNALQDLLQLQPAHRENFIASLMESASRGELATDQIDKVIRHPESAIRDAAWRLIAVSQTPAEILKAVWTKLFTGLRREPIYEGERYRSRYLGESWTESAALQSAVNSEAALLTLGRCGLKSSEFVPKFGPGFYNHPQTSVSPAMWGAFSLTVPTSAIIDVILLSPNWTAEGGPWRAAWVRANVPHPDKLAAFWNAVQAFLNGDAPEAQKQILRERTFEQSDIAATFGGAASRLSPTLLMSLIGAVPEDLWQGWRASLLLTLQNDVASREAFWSAARQSPALDGGFLSTRLLEDEEFAATFGLLETDALEADNPVFAPLILAWLRSHEPTLNRDNWIEAAIHPLPAVRDFALRQLEAIGLDVPGALRLLESSLPPSIRFGRNWFQNRGERHLDSALALCDSPQASVRTFGREFIAAHFEILLQAGLLGYLQENPNAEMQSFVAAQLLQRPQLVAPDFDRAVLRSRQRARRAKSLIQERTTTGTPLADDKTLLEIARGRTPRDAEWALAQLARRVLDGVQIEGVEISSRAEI